ncbi:unnamed protein product [Phytomonas sp. EM1]|nr:unnamed protein product [Phytomonas sp. EM1]|eukprot:CCW65711.1 unnamed protein product [Phytomonas sp. isolate EM1]
MRSQINGPSHDEIENQLREIKNEVNSASLLSRPDILNLTCALAREYENNDEFYSQVLSLFSASSNPNSNACVYSSIRYARRDGNCFYRCVAFRLCELILRDIEFAHQTLTDMRKTIRPRMHQQFGEYSDDFCDVAEGLVERICNGELSTVDTVYEAVINESEADYLIVYFRYAVSIYLRDHADEFIPFVMGLGYSTIELYCEAEVEPFFKDSDNVEIVAFAKLFDVTIHVEVLDPKAGQLTTLEIGSRSGAEVSPSRMVYLLFRPGHYDLLEL